MIPRRRASRSGVASVEFALATPLLLLLLAAIADLGFALVDMIQLTEGVCNAARYAELEQGAAATPTLQTIVQNTSRLSTATTTVSSASCFCASGTPATLTAKSCGTTCDNGAAAGTYQTITAQYAYSPLLPGYTLLANSTLSTSVTVQIK